VKRDAAALVFAMTFPAVMAWVYFVALATEGGKPALVLMIAYGAGKFVQFTFPAVYFLLTVWWVERRQLVVKPPHGRALLVGLVSGLLVGSAILGLYETWLRHSSLLANTPDKVYRKLQEFSCATPGRFIALAVFLSVFHSLLEEYYWRWFVFGYLRRYLRLFWAITLASLGFMAHHVIVLAVYFPGRFWTLALPFSLGVAIGGAFWAWLYERTGSLVAPWLSHMLIDLAIMAVGYEMLAGRYW
jgi:membrane protease YdiL (CAAX protease family)